MDGSDLSAAISAVATAIAAVIAAIAVVIGFGAAKRDRSTALDIHKSEQALQRLLALQPILASFDRWATARSESDRGNKENPYVKSLHTEFVALLRGSVEELPVSRSIVFDHIPKHDTDKAMEKFRVHLVGEEAGNGENSTEDQMVIRSEILYAMHRLRSHMLRVDDLAWTDHE